MAEGGQQAKHPDNRVGGIGLCANPDLSSSTGGGGSRQVTEVEMMAVRANLISLTRRAQSMPQIASPCGAFAEPQQGLLQEGSCSAPRLGQHKLYASRPGTTEVVAGARTWGAK